METAAIKATPGEWIRRAWEMVKQDLESFVVISLIFVVLLMAASTLAPVFGGILLAGVLVPGYYIICLRRGAGSRPSLNDLFAGFQYWVPGILTIGLTAFLTLIGAILLILPGILALTFYLFAPLFIVDKKMEFWPAMEASRKLVLHDLIGFFLLAFALVLLNILGFLCLFVGLFVTIPVTFMTVTVAYNELVGSGGFNPPPPPEPVNIP